MSTVVDSPVFSLGASIKNISNGPSMPNLLHVGHHADLVAGACGSSSPLHCNSNMAGQHRTIGNYIVAIKKGTVAEENNSYFPWLQ